MALLNILHYPDPRLRKKAAPVTQVTDETRRLIDDMLDTMHANIGIGLAATQVNVHQQIIVLDLSESHDKPIVLINPELVHKEGAEEQEEGCLSVPDYFDKVVRAQRIRVRALNRNGEVFEQDDEGLLAVCIQHEMDHLNGKLFVDYLSSLKQQRVRKKMEKWEKDKGKPATKPTAAAAVI